MHLTKKFSAVNFFLSQNCVACFNWNIKSSKKKRSGKISVFYLQNQMAAKNIYELKGDIKGK